MKRQGRAVKKEQVSKKQKFFVNITSNLVLIFAVVALSVIGLTARSLTVGAEPENVIFHGNKSNPKISLMINVYWGTEYIEGILEKLKNANVKCTFFVGGMWVEKNKEKLEKIIHDGHEIGNHAYTHKDHDRLTESQNREEIELTHKLVKEYTDISMLLFAPPSGAYSKTTLKVAASLGYKTIMWTRDTIDWRDKDSGVIYSRATNNMSNGDLILMHPTEKTLEALPQILSYVKAYGFSAVTVSECLA